MLLLNPRHVLSLKMLELCRDWIFDSDHRIFSINFRVLAPAKQYWGRQTHVTETKRIPRLNVSNLSRNDTVDQYNQLLLDMTRADLVSDVDLWQYAARRAGEKFCGDQVGPARPAWQEDNSEELAQLASQKQQAYRRSRSDPTTIPLYKALVRMHKHRVRQILNEWWANKAAEIQAEVDTKSPNYQYAGYRQLRKVFVMPKRPVSKLRGPNGEFLQTRVARVQRWETYFQDLLNVP